MALFMVHILGPDIYDDGYYGYGHLDLSADNYEHVPVFLAPENESEIPIIVWWTPFTAYNRIVTKCPEGECLFTHSRTERNNPSIAAFIFYGTELDWDDLPLPRRPNVTWALLHEESPKNNWLFAHGKAMSLFNFTATCSRYSSYPLTTQYLHNLKRLTQPVRVPTAEKSTGDLGLVMYVQSDCDPPSDRDTYVQELMKYVKVDSYGRCLHNRDLPEHLLDPLTFNSEDLFDIMAKYKFAIAFENAICHDYITEKFWRPFYAGSVPIVRGSPTINDWAPDREHSIIEAEDFDSPRELADYLIFLNQSDVEYEKYLEFKRSGVTNPMLLKHMEEREWVVDYVGEGLNFIDGFECYVCNQIHRRRKVKELPDSIANHNHYNCPIPEPSLDLAGETLQEKLASLSEHARSELEFWRYISRCSERKASAVADVINRFGTLEEVKAAMRAACAHLDFHG